MKSTKSYKKEYYKRNHHESPFDSLEEELSEKNRCLKDELDILQGKIKKIKDDAGRSFRAELIFKAQEVQERKLDISQIEDCLRYADNYERE